MPARSAIPRSAWLDVPALLPSRSELPSAENQKSYEVCGTTAKASSVNPTATPPATSAARRRPASQRYGTKIAGVSLTAEARPVSAPRHRPGDPTSRSTPTSASSSNPTWPNRNTSYTGCSCTAAAVSVTSHSARRRGAPASTPRKLSHTHPASSSTDSAVHRSCRTPSGTSASGTASSAANDGYVKGRACGLAGVS